MKKSITYILICSAIFLIANTNLTKAQNPLSVGQAQLNGGVGLSDWGIPLYFGFDYCVKRDITLGAEVSYRSYNEHWNKYHYDRSVIGISGNFNYHFNRILKIPRDWDFYAGLNLGYYIWNDIVDYYGDHHSGIGLGAQFGGRYYFNKSFGINLEFGGGNAFSNGKFGVSIKL